MCRDLTYSQEKKNIEERDIEKIWNCHEKKNNFTFDEIFKQNNKTRSDNEFYLCEKYCYAMWHC